jgi:hypothetical protein
MQGCNVINSTYARNRIEVNKVDDREAHSQLSIWHSHLFATGLRMLGSTSSNVP